MNNIGPVYLSTQSISLLASKHKIEYLLGFICFIPFSSCFVVWDSEFDKANETEQYGPLLRSTKTTKIPPKPPQCQA